MESITVFSPAKLNLFLAVTGRRADGFHDLLSLAATVKFGDELKIGKSNSDFTLKCSDPAVPVDEANLVLKAARFFRAKTGWSSGADFYLEKRIQMGAGLGGGSSNGVAALKGLNALAGQPLGAEEMAQLAGQLGSDCPLFLHEGPVIMRGRGERIDPLGTLPAGERLRGRRVLIFKPDFGISTAWAFGRKEEAGRRTRLREATPRQEEETFMAEEEAEGLLAGWLADETAPAEKLIFNNFETVVFEKFVALPVLLDRLRGDFGLVPRMTGSGSACFALLGGAGDPPVEKVTAAIREAWGASALAIETAIG